VWEDASEDGVRADTIPHLFPVAAVVPVPVVVPPQPPPPAVRRAVAGPGAVIMGQDGKTVRYMKKCLTCGKEDRNTSTAAIVRGTMKFSFFCSKCCRQRTAELQGR
jgi:hypothetical protein